MPAPAEPANPRATWRSIALLFAIGAVGGYVFSLIFIEGRGWPRLSHRFSPYVPIIDSDESLLFMLGMELLLGGLVAWLGEDAWSDNAFKSNTVFDLEHTAESLRWIRRIIIAGAACLLIAFARSRM